jgi:hypothetical protein
MTTHNVLGVHLVNVKVQFFLDVEDVSKVIPIIREITRAESFEVWYSSYLEDSCFINFEVRMDERIKDYLPKLREEFQKQGIPVQMDSPKDWALPHI